MPQHRQPVSAFVGVYTKNRITLRSHFTKSLLRRTAVVGREWEGDAAGVDSPFGLCAREQLPQNMKMCCERPAKIRSNEDHGENSETWVQISGGNP